MKVEREPVAFVPVTITLESREEVVLLMKVLKEGGRFAEEFCLRNQLMLRLKDVTGVEV